jgi:hypothetical protein
MKVAEAVEHTTKAHRPRVFDRLTRGPGRNLLDSRP